MNICKDCFCVLRNIEILYIDDKYIMVPMILYICSDCYCKYYIHNRPITYKQNNKTYKHYIIKSIK
jgi:hypothetical protein